MSDHYCPVEGCDYGDDEQKALGSVQGHINGSPDPDHDWSELRERVEAQADDAATDEESDEGNEEGGASAPDSEQSESDDGESSEETNPETDESDDETMPTDEEYDQQREARDSGEDDESDEETDDSDDLPIPALPVDPRTLMMLVAVAGLAWLLYRTVSGSDEETPAPERSETPEFEAPDDDSETEVQGGLV